ncbi:MAG: type II toxin-antitoxin system VapC family toxin [Chromatiales bacterium]
MRVLLDTHAFLWLVTDDSRLSRKSRSVFLDDRNDILISAVTGFEIAVKYSLGKLELSQRPDLFIAERIAANALTVLPLAMGHGIAVGSLPFHHRDPFDRLLIAQALIEQIPVLSNDKVFNSYGVKRIW